MLWLWILVGLAGLLVLSWGYTCWHVARAERRHRPEGRFVEVQGVRTHVVRRGQGPPVLFLHGLAGLHRDVDPVTDIVADTFEVVTLDRPGYGYSSRPRAELSDPRAQAGWLVELMDALDLDAPIVVGHSWGGGLAVTLATRYPTKIAGLVLVAPYIYPRTEPDAWVHRLPRLPRLRSLIGHTLLAPGGRLLAPRFVAASFEPEPLDPGYHQRWLDMVLRPGHFGTTIDEVRAIDPALATVRDRYPELAVPTIIVTGDRDTAVGYRRNAQALAEVVPSAEVRILEGAGHMVPWLHPEVVAEAIRDVRERAQLGPSP